MRKTARFLEVHHEYTPCSAWSSPSCARGSFTAAAKSLFITQPTLSHQIRQIEEQLGSPIFTRSKTAIELTPAGHVYVQAARRILQIETQMNEALGALSGTSEGILRLGLPAQRADELLPQVLADFYALYPNVRIEALTAQQQELERMLLGGELHHGSVVR